MSNSAPYIWTRPEVPIPIQHVLDAYKLGHPFQYPKGTTRVVSNLTARQSRYPDISETIYFGGQFFNMEILLYRWGNDFFSRPKHLMLSAFERRARNMGCPVTVEHLDMLHDEQMMPLDIWALPEGTRVPMRIASSVFWNTVDHAFWVTNMIETQLSFSIWPPCTSAPIADAYRKIYVNAMARSGGDPNFIKFQGHDFSGRGMSSEIHAALSGAAHMLSFAGTDTVWAIDMLESYYGANSDTELVGASVPASEHAVICAGEKEQEIETLKRMLTEVYPSKVYSHVSDTWDFWNVITVQLPLLKPLIMERDGCLTIRPDSGDPVKIIIGDPDAVPGSPEFKGAWECLWEIFGGTVNAAGFKDLDSHVGMIYGDSINLDRSARIKEGLLRKGFVPRNIDGIGSFTYQFVTRDNFSQAVKATQVTVDGVERDIYKQPKTDSSGMKFSARGIPVVYWDEHGVLKQKDHGTLEELYAGAMHRTFRNSELYNFQVLADIRRRLHGDSF